MNPTQYQNWWNQEGIIVDTKDELKKMNDFHKQLLEKIRNLEYEGQYVVTDQQHRFLEIDDKFYEPPGQEWILDARYC